jgi:hypothetical protein
MSIYIAMGLALFFAIATLIVSLTVLVHVWIERRK